MKTNQYICLVLSLVFLFIHTPVGLGQERSPAAIRLEQIVICQNVVNRSPVGVGDVFPKEVKRLYCFTRLISSQGDTEVTHNWYYQGKLKASIVLPVKSKKWRTWSSKTILAEWTGEWMVEILNQDSVPLESVIFVVR